jgi:hypothetical protein
MGLRMSSLSRDQPRVSSCEARVKTLILVDRRAIEFDRPPCVAATPVGNLDAIRLFARWCVPAQIGTSLLRRNPGCQATGEPFPRAWIERHTNRYQNGAGIARTRDSVRFHPPKRQHLRAGGRTSGAIGRRRSRRNNLGGANESDAVLRDLVFARLTFVFAFCNFRPGLARRFGGVRTLLTIRRRLLGTRYGDDARDQDESGTTNVHTLLIYSRRPRLREPNCFQKKSRVCRENIGAFRLDAATGGGNITAA